eukprot:GHVU01100207.1.p1 GENE.GHVU01100207.1~~GHVU01100207.1.p1  ORF type:complete len:125 (-),score=13.40 GHVU01100207.1:2166-2540(-)
MSSRKENIRKLSGQDLLARLTHSHKVSRKSAGSPKQLLPTRGISDGETQRNENSEAENIARNETYESESSLSVASSVKKRNKSSAAAYPLSEPQWGSPEEWLQAHLAKNPEYGKSAFCYLKRYK